MQQNPVIEQRSTYTIELGKSETPHVDMDAVLDALKIHVDAHPAAAFITTLDRSPAPGKHDCLKLDSSPVASKLMVFSFDIGIPSPGVLVVRPHTLGVTEFVDRFVFSFLALPEPVADNTVAEWVGALRN